MSSFLDSTGLSRLVSKITDYFAKKDGTYPDMTVGNVSNVVPITKLPTASSVTSGDTTHVPTADAVYNSLNEYVYLNKEYSASYNRGKVASLTWSGSLDNALFEIDFTYSPNNNTIQRVHVVLNISGSVSNPTVEVFSCGFINKQYNKLSNSKVGWFYSSGEQNVQLWFKGSDSAQSVSAKIAIHGYKASAAISVNAFFVSSTSWYAPDANTVLVYQNMFVPSAIGSPSVPVYVDASGEVKPCYVVRRYSSWANSVRFTKSLSAAWNDGQSVVITSAAWRHHKTMFSVSFVISGTITASNPLGTEGSVRIVRMNNNIGNPPSIYYRVTDDVVEFVLHGMNGLSTNCPIYVDEYGISTALSADWSSSGYSLITNPTRLTPNFTTF